MEQGDIVVVELQAGPRLARFVEEKGRRVRVGIGRNREARLPADRLLMKTGVPSASFDTVELMTQGAETVADSLDLEEVWEVVCDDGLPLTLDDISELYWGEDPSPQRKVGVLLNLHRDGLRFARDGDHYVPKSREEVADALERRERAERRAADAANLVNAVREGRLPDEPLSAGQTEILDRLRGLAIYGDEYPRANSAKQFMEDAEVVGIRNPKRAAFETLVKLGLMDEDEHIDLPRAEISEEFSDAALAEAERLDPMAPLADSYRVDLTELPAFTIDDEDTRDRDDALSLEWTPNGTYRVGIHITDVGALIEPGSALDDEADERISSLYLPEQTIHMLPPALSSDKGSLNPGELRAAISVLVEFDPSGDYIVGRDAKPSVIRSRAALSYAEADAAIADENHPLHASLSTLNRMAQKRKSVRDARGALNFDRDEMSVKVDADGEIAVSVSPRAAPSRSLIQEYMILCNCILAEYCVGRGLPAPFRSQTMPDVTDITAQVADGPLRWHMIGRRMLAAKVSATPASHGGLGVRAYTQATSPLRRYPDMIVQRQISNHLRRGETLYDTDAVTSIAHRSDLRIREMSRIENRRRNRFFLKWLDARRRATEAAGSDSVHPAVVLENPINRAATVELAEWPFRSRAALPNGVKPGETVNLKLHGVDLWRGSAQLTLAIGD